MITRWLIAKREAALFAWAAEAVHTGTRLSVPSVLRAARRRLSFWDLLLDAWTLNGRR